MKTICGLSVPVRSGLRIETPRDGCKTCIRRFGYQSLPPVWVKVRCSHIVR